MRARWIPRQIRCGDAEYVDGNECQDEQRATSHRAIVTVVTSRLYNAGFVKYSVSTLLHPLRDERHFALVEMSAIPTKARS